MNYFVSLILTLILSMSTAAGAQGAALSKQDTQFLRQAAEAGIFEMQASQLAMQNATQERVKEFARLMLVEHEKIDGDLKSLAMMRKIELPIDLEGDRQETLDALQQDTGEEFDKRYVEQIAVEAHKHAVTLFTEASEKSDDDEIKAFAGKTVKMLRQHLQHARNLKAAAFK